MLCPMCQVEMKYVKAGVSKSTGKPYNAFYSCPDCKETMNADVKVMPTIQKAEHKNGFNDDFGYKCNAMNNASHIVGEMIKLGGVYNKEELETIYTDILGILKR